MMGSRRRGSWFPRDADIRNSINRNGMTAFEGVVNPKFRIFKSFLTAIVIHEKGVTPLPILFQPDIAPNTSGRPLLVLEF